MKGETNIHKILITLRPELQSDKYVFVSLAYAIDKINVPTIAEVQEPEGRSLIVRKADADHQGWSYDFEAAWIILRVHSSLHAVGLTALIAQTLSRHNLSCNVVAGFYHDHLFVEYDQKEKVLDLLNEITAEKDLRK